METTSQIQRQIKVLQLLSSGRKITIKELLSYFQYTTSIRTLQRDLLALSEAGVPLVSEKIKANENIWWIDSPFRSIVRLPLETNEYLAAYILKTYLKVFKNTKIESDVHSLMDKIDQLVPDNVFMEVKQSGAESFFENYSAGVFDYSPHGHVINDMIQAILNRVKCRVTYYNPGRQKLSTYHIEPEKMVYYNGSLYAIVYIRHYKQFILLAIQRIQSLDLTDTQYPRDHSFNPDSFWKGKFGLFSGDPVDVKLKFSKEILHHIDDRTWHVSQKKVYDKKGNLILTMHVALSPELITWIMGWHQYVTVLEPPQLIDEIKENAAKIIDNY